MTDEMTGPLHPWAAAFIFMGLSLIPSLVAGVPSGSIVVAIGVWFASTMALVILHLRLVHRERRGLVYMVLGWSTPAAEASSRVRVFKGAFLPED